MSKNGIASANTKVTKAKRIQRFSESFRLLNILNFNFFYGLSLLIMLAPGGAAINFTLIMLVNGFFGLPLALIVSPIQALFSYREAKEKKWQTNPTIRFILDALYAVAMLALALAVYIPILFPTLASLPIILVFNIPLIIAAVLGRAIYNIATGIYQINKANSGVDEFHHDRAVSKAIANLGSGLGYGMIAASMVALYFFPLMIPPAVFFIGAIGCTLIFVSIIITIRNTFERKPSPTPPETSPAKPEVEFNSTTLNKTLGAGLNNKAEHSTEPNPVNRGGILSSEPTPRVNFPNENTSNCSP